MIPSFSDDFDSSTDAVSAPPSDNSGGTGLTDIGTFSVHGTGVTVTTDVSVGDPVTGNAGAPPEDVLDSCNWNYSSVIDTSVFIHGSLTITYSGAVADLVQITPGSSIRQLNNLEQLGGGTAGIVGLQDPNGGWDNCGGSNTSWVHQFQPGTTQTVEWWADLQVLSNAHPSFTADDKDALALGWFAFPSESLGVTPSITGTGAANCGTGGEDQMPFLLLYNSPPADYQGQDANGTPVDERCRTP